MAEQTDFTPELLAYVRQVSLREDPILAELRQETAELPMGRAQQVLAEEGQLLGLLVQLTGARTVVEVGTFTGYSTLCMARALPAGGTLVTYDISPRWTRIARPYWARAGVADRIDARVGDAAVALAALREELGERSVDLVFIDADKAGYLVYYEHALALLRPGGLAIVDNTAFFGRVSDPAVQDPDTVAVRTLNAALLGDDRVDIALLPMADGITLARKKDHVARSA